MTGDPSTDSTGASRRDEFAHAAGAFVDLVARIGPASWERPALGEWNLRDLVGHTSRSLSTIEAYTSRTVEGPAPADMALADPVAYYVAVRDWLEDPAAVTERGKVAGRALGEDPAGAVATLATRVRRLVETTADDAVVDTLLGRMLFVEYLPTRTFELTVHTLDLARALREAEPSAGGWRPALGPALPASLLLAARLAATSPDAADLLLLLTGRTGLPGGLSVL